VLWPNRRGALGNLWRPSQLAAFQRYGRGFQTLPSHVPGLSPSRARITRPRSGSNGPKVRTRIGFGINPKRKL